MSENKLATSFRSQESQKTNASSTAQTNRDYYTTLFKFYPHQVHYTHFKQLKSAANVFKPLAKPRGSGLHSLPTNDCLLLFMVNWSLQTPLQSTNTHKYIPACA